MNFFQTGLANDIAADETRPDIVVLPHLIEIVMSLSGKSKSACLGSYILSFFLCFVGVWVCLSWLKRKINDANGRAECKLRVLRY